MGFVDSHKFLNSFEFYQASRSTARHFDLERTFIAEL
jgi:hypothetical protein